MLKWPKHSYISLILSNSKNAMRIQKMRCRLCNCIGSVCEPERLRELFHGCWRRFSIQKTKGVCARKTVLWRWKVACCSIPLTGSSFKGSRNQPQIFFSTRKRKWNVAQLSTILEQSSHPRNVGQWIYSWSRQGLVLSCIDTVELILSGPVPHPGQSMCTIRSNVYYWLWKFSHFQFPTDKHHFWHLRICAYSWR